MKNIGTLWLVVFISLMGFGVTTIPFPLVAEQMGASDFWKTFGGGGVFSVFQLIATPLWGRYSDAVGRKPILVASLLGSVLAYVWLACADTLTSLVLARALGGIMSGNLAAAFAYATDVTDVKNRARGLGIVTSAFGIGFAVGPPIGGFLGAGSGGAATLHAPALLSAGFSVLAAIGVVFFLKESLPPAARRPFRGRNAPKHEPGTTGDGARASGGVFGKPVLVGLMVASLLVSIGGAAMQSVYQFWSRDLLGLGLREVGLQFMFFAICSAVGQAGLVGPLVRWFGEKRVAIVSTVGGIIGLMLFAAAGTAGTVWVAMGVFGLSLGLFSPVVTSLVSFEAEPRERGAVMGAFNAASSAGRIVGPAMSGPVYFNVGHSAPFVLSAAMTAIAGVLLIRAHGARPARGSGQSRASG